MNRLKDETQPPADSILGFPNLVAYYRLDGDASDHGNVHNGKAISALPRSFGRNRGSYEFDGDGDHIEVAHSSQFNLKTFTIAAWIRPITGKSWFHRHTIVGKGQGTTTYVPGPCYYWFYRHRKSCPSWARIYSRDHRGTTPVNIAVQRGHVYVYYGPGSGSWQLSAHNVIDTNEWSHVVTSYDGSTLNIYVNGELKSSRPAPPPPFNRSNLTIGRLADQHDFRGLIDDVAIVGHALLPSEIRRLFNRAPRRPPSYGRHTMLEGAPGARQLIGRRSGTPLPNQVFFDEQSEGPILHAEFQSLQATIIYRPGPHLQRLRITGKPRPRQPVFILESLTETLDNITEKPARTVSTASFYISSSRRRNETIFGIAPDGGNIQKRYFYDSPRGSG